MKLAAFRQLPSPLSPESQLEYLIVILVLACTNDKVRLIFKIPSTSKSSESRELVKSIEIKNVKIYVN